MNEEFDDLLKAYRNLEINQSKTLFDQAKIDFVYHSNKLEGSALTLIQTKDVIHNHKSKGETSIIDSIMAIDHFRALNSALTFGANKYPLTEKILLSIHQTLLKNSFELDPFYQSWKDNGQQLGEYKVKTNRILYQLNDTETYYQTPSPKESAELIKNIILNYNQSSDDFIEKLSKLIQNIYNAHPFFDGNKRMTRLLIANQLMVNSLPLIPIPFQKGEYNKALVDGMIEQSHLKIKIYLVKVFNQYLAKSIEEFKNKTKKPNKGFGLIL